MTNTAYSPADAFRFSIDKWEGEWQADPRDRGNYAHGHDGSVRLVGTMRGVTPDTYARFLGVDPATITVDMMKAITLDRAVAVAMKLFYVEPGLARLHWSPPVEIVADWGWCSGPAKAIGGLQRAIGAYQDGSIGPQTEVKLDQLMMKSQRSLFSIIGQVTAARCDFLATIGHPNETYWRGWNSRAAFYEISNKEWWDRWSGWMLSYGDLSTKPVA